MAKKRKSLPLKQRKEIFNRDHWLCWYCGHEIALGMLGVYVGGFATVDHRIPVAWGGTDDPPNLSAACHRCQSQKGALSVEAFREKLLHTLGLCCVKFFGECTPPEWFFCDGKARPGYRCRINDPLAECSKKCE
jgi:hypothetical protein